jgi:hypothetical protein
VDRAVRPDGRGLENSSPTNSARFSDNSNSTL